jgi:hypothetical protein
VSLCLCGSSLFGASATTEGSDVKLLLGAFVVLLWIAPAAVVAVLRERRKQS